MVLLRHLLGDVLRRLRLRQGRTLREVSASARVSLGYLSEVERGQKEASSELLSAICTALETPLSHVLREVSDNFALAELQSAPVLTGPREPVLHPAGKASIDSRAEPALRAAAALDAAQDGVLGTVRLRTARPELRTTRPELRSARPGEPPLVRDGTGFERVAHHTDDITDMVPV
jgi:transcriptional regulator with XRE-family HTH domain